MALDGISGDDEFFGYFRICKSFVCKLHDFTFAASQVVGLGDEIQA